MDLLRKKILLLFIRPSMDTVEYAIASSGKILRHGSCDFDQLKELAEEEKLKYARVSFLTELSYFDRTTVRVKNKKFINFAVKKYINDQAVFVDSFVYKFKLLKSDQQQVVGICAIPEEDLKFITKLQEMFVVEYVFPVEIALFSFAYKLNSKVKSVVWTKDDLQLTLTIDNGFILNKSVSSYVSEIESISEDELILNKENYPLAHLEGLLYPFKECDFLPMEYIRDVVSFEASKLSLVLSSAIFVVLAVLSGMDYVKYSNLRAEFSKKSDLLNSKIAFINTYMPHQDEAKTLNDIYKFVNEEKNELDLGGFLSWLTHIVPSDSIITMIDIKREGISNNNENGYSNQYSQDMTQENTGFMVKLKLKIDGSYIEAKSSAKMFLKDLSKKVKLQDSRFEYDKDNNGAVLYTQFRIKGRIKWQSL